MRILFKTGVSLTVITLVCPVATLSAEGITFSIEGMAGISDDDGLTTAGSSDFTGGGLGSVNFDGPVVFQFDALGFSHRDGTAIGGAFHAGARTGNQTYLGIYGSLSDVGRIGGLETLRVGGEVEHDFGDWTLSMVGGYEDIGRVTTLVSATPTRRTFES